MNHKKDRDKRSSLSFYNNLNLAFGYTDNNAGTDGTAAFTDSETQAVFDGDLGVLVL